MGSLDRGSSHRYAANQSGPIRGGAAVLHGEVRGGVHQQRVMGFDSDLAIKFINFFLEAAKINLKCFF